MINRIAFSFLAALLACSALAVELTDAQRAAIEERIKPVGESCMAGDSSCGGARCRCCRGRAALRRGSLQHGLHGLSQHRGSGCTQIW